MSRQRHERIEKRNRPYARGHVYMEWDMMIMLKWVKMEKYCELSGDTPDAVENKRRSGKWVEGVHWRIPADGRVWVNMEEVQKWAETSQPLKRRAA